MLERMENGSVPWQRLQRNRWRSANSIAPAMARPVGVVRPNASVSDTKLTPRWLVPQAWSPDPRANGPTRRGAPNQHGINLPAPDITPGVLRDDGVLAIGVPVAPFPRWLVCPQCRLLAPTGATFCQTYLLPCVKGRLLPDQSGQRRSGPL
jgi:hypothetical protein